MGFSKKRMGEYLVQIDARNSNNVFGEEYVRGISTGKAFIPTKANLQGVSLSNYKVVAPDHFAYVPDTSRRGNKISLAYNDTPESYLVSSISVVFGVKPEKKDELLGEYLFLYFNRPEFDRYARFNSWGSARETFSWEDLCETEIVLPDIQTQRNCVNVYCGIQENLNALHKSAERLQYTYMICMDNIKKSAPLLRLGDHITQLFERNMDEKLGIDRVRGVSNTKEIQRTKANVSMRDLSTFLVIRRNQFVFNRRTTRNGERLGLGFNDTDEPLLFTNDYVAFEIRDTDVLLPEYLYLYFKRDEFDRYVRYNSWGSATEFFNWEDMQEVRVPVPDISTQKALADIYWIHKKRRELAERLEKQQKDICPILVRGAIEEGGR